MKKRFLLALVMSVVLVLALAIAVSADSVHAGKVDLNQKVTLENGAEVNLFDNEGNALIWYNNNGTLDSIRADDQRVKYKATYSFNVGNSTVGSVAAYEVSDMWIALESGNINKGNIVVLNLMDDDVLVNEASNTAYIGKSVNCLKTIAWANKVIEYAYLRLDTVAIQQQAFNGCPKLKYINLENLTELRQIGGSQTFGQTVGQTVLFAGQTLDLSATKLTTLGGDGAFNNVPFVGLKFPSTITNINSWCLQGTGLVSFAFPTGVATINGSQFNDAKSLKEIYINSTTTKINERSFNNTPLEKIFYVGTLDQLTALLNNTNATYNAPLMAVIGDNRSNLISYEDYKKLEDKSGKYVVYNYNYCEAYNKSIHELDPTKSNACAGVCGLCGETALAPNPVHDYVTTIVYTNYLAKGTKTQTCQNPGCAHNTAPYETSANAIIASFKGFSTKEIGNGLTFGYTLNLEAIKEYEAVNSTTLEFGFVVAAQAFLGDNAPLDKDGNAASNNVIKASLTSDKYTYTGADFRLTSASWDGTANINGVETALKDIKFYMAGYILDGTSVIYINDGATGDKADALSYNDISGTEVIPEETPAE